MLLSDLYYHLEGELEGRKISAGPFKELSEYLIESKVLQHYQHKCDCDGDFLATCKDLYLFDTDRVRADLGSDLWDFSKWKTSKAIAERMLHHMIDANSTVLLRNSKRPALRSLITVLTINGKDVSSLNLIAFDLWSAAAFLHRNLGKNSGEVSCPLLSCVTKSACKEGKKKRS